MGRLLFLALVGFASVGLLSSQETSPAGEDRELLDSMRRHIERLDGMRDELNAPEFPVGKTWFNSAPLALGQELRGKIVVLDFWTYCCINCIHVLPELARLEEKYAGYPVAFVGVHSAKFANEKVDANIRDAILRYEIEHAVINDDEMTMWRQIGVRAWPSLVVIGPHGNLLLMLSGEGNEAVVDAAIRASLDFYPPEVFRWDPLEMRPEADSDAVPTGALRYPGKVLVDESEDRLFISDSNHNRILVTTLGGKTVSAIGTGEMGLADGDYQSAMFNRPQGMMLVGDNLYVADTENHAIRVIDLVGEQVSTLVGDGVQGRDYSGGQTGSEQRLSNPWDLVLWKTDRALIAMAGTHQIWELDLVSGIASAYSGTGEERNRNDTDRRRAAWAQPSGLAIGADELWIADSESSAIRGIELASGATRTIVGGVDDEPTNLFAFGDVDGVGDGARLQHPLGVAWDSVGNRLLVADTYNHRIKVVHPSERRVDSWVGSGVRGDSDGSASTAQFSEPSGLAIAEKAGKVFVADTNNHRIRVIDLESETVRSLPILGAPVPAPAVAPRSRPLTDLPQTTRQDWDGITLRANAVTEIHLTVQAPEGYKGSQGTTNRWQVSKDGLTGMVSEGPLEGTFEFGDPIQLRLRPTGTGGARRLELELLAYFCREDADTCVLGSTVLEALPPLGPDVEVVESRYRFAPPAPVAATTNPLESLTPAPDLLQE